MLNEDLLRAGEPSSTEPSTETPPKKSSCRRYCRDILITTLSVYPLLLGFSRWHGNCDSIPSLPIFLVCLGGVGVIRSVLSLFRGRVPRQHRKIKLTIVSLTIRVLSLIMLGLIIWGAVISLQHINDNFPNGGDDCSRLLYISGLIYSLVPLGFILLALLSRILRRIIAKCYDKGRRHRDIRFFYESYYSSDSDSEFDSDSSYYSEDEGIPGF